MNEETAHVSSVYPVNASNESTIQLQPKFNNGKVSITDLSGGVVYNAAFNSNTIFIPVIEFSNGMYVISVSSNNRVHMSAYQLQANPGVV